MAEILRYLIGYYAEPHTSVPPGPAPGAGGESRGSGSAERGPQNRFSVAQPPGDVKEACRPKGDGPVGEGPGVETPGTGGCERPAGRGSPPPIPLPPAAKQAAGQGSFAR